MQELMDLAARLIHHERQCDLRFGRQGSGCTPWVGSIQRGGLAKGDDG
jgi:hypothetical protein